MEENRESSLLMREGHRVGIELQKYCRSLQIDNIAEGTVCKLMMVVSCIVMQEERLDTRVKLRMLRSGDSSSLPSYQSEGRWKMEDDSL